MMAMHRKDWSPNPGRFLLLLEEDVLTNDPVKRYNWLWYSEDLLPLYFTDSGIKNATVVSQGFLEYGIAYLDSCI